MKELPSHTPGPVQRTIAVVVAVLPASLFLSSWRVRESLPFMQFLWILGGTLLALDLVFFIAAWRRGFRWFFGLQALRFYAWVALGLISFVVLYYAEESWRGKRAWAALQREAAGRGESLEFSLPAIPTTPDEQNFAKAPGIAELLLSTNATHWDGAFYHGREHEWPAASPSASWTFQQFTDLAEWQKYFHDRAEKSPAENVREEDRIFPATPEPQSPAADVLLALSRFETNLATLRAASRRPALHLPLDYSKGFLAGKDLYRLTSPLRSAAHLLALRASAELAQGQAEAASQDILLALRLAELLRGEPFAPMKRISRDLVGQCFQPLWEGLAAQRWNEAQLAALQRQLAGPDLVADYRRGARGEMLMMQSLFDQGLAFVTGQPSEFERRMSPTDAGDRFAGWLAKTFYPVGWLYQDKVWVYHFFQRNADPFDAAGVGDQPRKGWPAEFRTVTDPMLMVWVMPKLKDITAGSRDALIIQTFLHQAATACALERFRLAQGEYPPSLEALVTGYLAQVPADILARTPSTLKYRRTDDGGFLLYSVGLDRADDGGKIYRPADPRYASLRSLDKSGCDLVWVQPGRQSANIKLPTSK